MTPLGIGSLSPDMMWGEGQDEVMGGPAFGDILRAVEWQESRGRDDAVSPKGAYGAMQLMPGAVMDYARAHGLPTDPQTIETLRRDPAKNREIGAWYLQQVQGQFGGELVPALAAYNAGPGRVKRVLAGFGGKYSPEIEADFIAQLPAETRDYIAKIRGRLGNDAPSTEAPRMPQPEIDVDQSLANMSQMSQRVGQMRPGAGVSALPDRPQQQPAQGLSALNPYLQIAQQLMPQRENVPWADALVSAGAAMMQSRSPDFLGGLGAGVAAGNQTLAQGRNQGRQDTLDRFNLGMKLAQFDQKDGGEYAMSDGVLYNKKTGQTQQVGSGKAPQTREVKRGDRIITQEWNGAMWKDVGEAPAQAPPAGFMRGPDGKLIADPGYLDAQKQIREAGRPTTNIDLKGETKEKEAVGKAMGEMYADKVSLGAKGQQMFDTVTRAEQLMEGLNTGALAPAALSAQKYLSALGIPLEVFGNAAQLGQGEAAMAVANQMALQLRSTGEGAGMPGAMSDKDREFLVSMAPGLGQTPEGRRMIIDSFKRLALRQIEESRLAEQWYEDKGTMKGFNSFMRDYAQKNPVFAGMQMPAAPTGGAGATPGPSSGATPGPRGLPPSDADIRRQQQQQAPAQPQSGGSGLPMPKRFDLGGPKVGARPQGDIPTFTDPNDPALAKLPSGSVFRDGSGTLRFKP